MQRTIPRTYNPTPQMIPALMDQNCCDNNGHAGNCDIQIFRIKLGFAEVLINKIDVAAHKKCHNENERHTPEGKLCSTGKPLINTAFNNIFYAHISKTSHIDFSAELVFGIRSLLHRINFQKLQYKIRNELIVLYFEDIAAARNNVVN